MKVLLLESDNYLYIQSPYHEKLNELYKSYPDATFSIENSSYRFSISDRENLIKKLLDLNVNVEQVNSFPEKPKPPKNAIYQINDNYIEIAISYSQKVIEVLRKYKGKFNGFTTRWTVAIEFEENLLKDLIQLGFKVETGEFPAVKPKKIKALVKKSEDIFEIIVPYKQEITDYFKTINGKKFDGLTLRWSFPICEFQTVFLKLSDLCDCVEKVEEFPPKKNTAKFSKKD